MSFFGNAMYGYIFRLGRIGNRNSDLDGFMKPEVDSEFMNTVNEQKLLGYYLVVRYKTISI